jgi:hypothetical protein
LSEGLSTGILWTFGIDFYPVLGIKVQRTEIFGGKGCLMNIPLTLAKAIKYNEVTYNISMD